MILAIPRSFGVARRLYTAAALSLLAVVALATAAVYFANLTGRAAQTLYGGSFVGVIEATELELLVEKHRRIVEAAPLEFDRNQIRRDRRNAEETQEHIQRLLKRSAAEFSELMSSGLAEIDERSKVVLHLAENFAQEKALEAVDRYSAAAGKLQDKIRTYRSQRVEMADHETQQLASRGKALTKYVLGVALVALVLIGPLSLGLIRSTILRLSHITDAMSRLARNETSINIAKLEGPDEIGDMARAVDVFRANAVTLLDQKSRLEKLNLWLDVALNNMSRGLSMFDSNQRLIVCNATYARLYDLPAELTRPGTPFSTIAERRSALLEQLDIKNDAGQDLKTEAGLALVVERRRSERFSQTFLDGRIVEVSIKPLETGGWVALHEDVTERVAAAENIERLARRDGLTGLANRLRFNEELNRVWAHAIAGRPFALICLDLDRFKLVNDTFGHPVGDALLGSVAERLEASVRRGDVVARLGGDEFAIIQVGAGSRRDAEVLGRRLVERLSRPYQIQGHRVEIGATVGIALAPEDARDAEQLLRNADMALYRAKADGKGRLAFFDPAMEGRLRARRQLEIDLQTAIDAGQLELFYQPIINLEARRISGCEALIRWRHPIKGLVSPADFIPIAEETGLIVPIGSWALRQACRDAASWKHREKVAVNLSPAQFGGPDLYEIVKDALQESGLDASRLELEVTESLLIDDDPAIIELLHRLRSLGIKIALDDFGTGYSSLSYLRSFPFDKIKIDQTFVRDLSQRKDCVAIVSAVAQLAKSLAMTTVAEGVETEDHLEKVNAAGCTEVQGYLFSRPVPATEILAAFETCNVRCRERLSAPQGTGSRD